MTAVAASPDGQLTLTTRHGDATAAAVNDPNALNRISVNTRHGRSDRTWGDSYDPVHGAVPLPTRTGFRAGDQPQPSPIPVDTSVVPGPTLPPPLQTPPLAGEPQAFLRPVARTAEAADLVRLGRAVKQADLAVENVDWQRDEPTFQSMATAYGLAASMKGDSDPARQAKRLSDLRLQYAESIIGQFGDTPGARSRIGAMYVATGIGWIQNFAPIELYNQLQTSGDLHLGMPPDVQTVAFNAMPEMEELSAEVRELFRHPRIQTTVLSGQGDLAVDILPDQQPTDELCEIVAHNVHTTFDLDGALVEKLRQVDRYPAMSLRTITASSAVEGADPYELVTMIQRESAAAYPRVTSGGEPITSDPTRHLLVVQSARDAAVVSRLETLARSHMRRPNTLDLYVPDGTNYKILTEWGKKFPGLKPRYNAERGPGTHDLDRLLGMSSGEPKAGGQRGGGLGFGGHGRGQGQLPFRADPWQPGSGTTRNRQRPL